MDEVKVCSKCLQKKPLPAFHARSVAKGMKKSACAACESARSWNLRSLVNVSLPEPEIGIPRCYCGGDMVMVKARKNGMPQYAYCSDKCKQEDTWSTTQGICRLLKREGTSPVGETV